MAYLGVYGAKDYTELIEEFPASCHRCRGHVPHGRIEVTRRDTIFWIPFRTIGEPYAIIRCRRCGNESHIRDMTDLSSPVMLAKYTYALRAAIVGLLGEAPHHEARRAAVAAIASHYSIYTNIELDADRAARLAERLDAALDALHVEAGPPIAQQFIEQLIPVAVASDRDVDRVTESLRPIAVAFNVTSDQLQRAVAAALTEE